MKNIILFIVFSCVTLSNDAQNMVERRGFVIEFDEVLSKEDIRLLFEQQTANPMEDIIINTGRKFALISFKNTFLDQEMESIKKQMIQNNQISYISSIQSLSTGSFSADLSTVFIKMQENANIKDLEPIFLKHDARFWNNNTYLPLVIELTLSKHTNSAAIIAELKAHTNVEYVSKNQVFSIVSCAVNDTFYARQWALSNEGTSLQGSGTIDADLDVDSAWTITTGSPMIKIAIIDSGTDTLHPDLQANMLPGFDATGNNSNGFPGTDYSDDGHGTCTAGIAGAVGDNSIGIAGVAYSCKIIPVRMFTYINFLGQIVPYSTTQMGIDAMNWAAFTAKADVLSNSWGIRDSEIPILGIDTMLSNDVIENIIHYGRDSLGLPTFFSSGNDPVPYSIWPASLPSTISVGATSMCDELKTSSDCSPENWGSNHGAGLDISAPGTRIVATDVRLSEGFSPNDYYYFFNGTSASCPLVAGVAALMLSINPDMNGYMVRQIISETCDKVGGYAYDSTKVFGSWSMELGYGRVNAYKAVLRSQEAIGIQDNLLNHPSIFISYNTTTLNKFLHIQLPQNNQIDVEIYNLMGQKMYTYSAVGSAWEIPLSFVSPNNIHIARVKVGQKVYHHKF